MGLRPAAHADAAHADKESLSISRYVDGKGYQKIEQTRVSPTWNVGLVVTSTAITAPEKARDGASLGNLPFPCGGSLS